MEVAADYEQYGEGSRYGRHRCPIGGHSLVIASTCQIQRHPLPPAATLLTGCCTVISNSAAPCIMCAARGATGQQVNTDMVHTGC